MKSEYRTFCELTVNRDLKVVKFGGDYFPPPESLGDLKTMVEECEDLYPGIDVWFKKKVVPGLEQKNRVAFLVYHDSRPIGSAVVRKGEDAKLCSLRVLPEEQKKGIGHLLMALVANEIRNMATHFHFTAPSKLWFELEQFFKSYGFVNNGLAGLQYRLFDEELACSANFDSIWQGVLKKLPLIIENFTLNGNKAHCDLVFSIRPTYAERIINGSKRVEVRRRFSNKWKGATALLYASSPLRHFVGEAIIGEVIASSPDKIWSDWKEELGCTFDEFTSYCHGASEVSAIIFKEVTPFKYPIPQIQMEHLVQRELKAPQSFLQVKKQSLWPTALSLSCLLRANLPDDSSKTDHS
ncbi:MAG: GNAT family N-acetyltransferase [candidate division Zixibacteria bacterium]|nr:GNAT family N-acetyltransferase [candidate division Zixibacteria bacterium]